MTTSRRILKYAGVALLALILLGVCCFLTDIHDVPAVESVQNEFANVADTPTTIETKLHTQPPQSYRHLSRGVGGIPD